MSSPIDERNQTDRGDETLHRYRYQFGYGVILLVGAATKQLDYRAIWCEQQEDFLAEATDGRFDAYQVKTREPEQGEWDLNDEALWKSIRRFVDLNHNCPGRIRFFKFVSNTKYSESTAKRRAYLSPKKLLSAVSHARGSEELPGAANKGFKLLENKINVKPDELFACLRQLDLVSGPTLGAFEDELAQRHLPSLAGCSNLSASALALVRDTLIAKVSRASSLVTDDPTGSYVGLNCHLRNDPLLSAKRITVEECAKIVREQLPTSSGPDLIEVEQDRYIRVKNFNGKLLYEFPWELGLTKGTKVKDAPHWKKLHSKTERLFSIFWELQKKMTSTKASGPSDADNLMNVVGSAVSQFSEDLNGLPIRGSRILQILANLPVCITPIRRSLGDPIRSSSFQNGVVLTERIGHWLLDSLHIVDQVLERHFKEQ